MVVPTRRILTPIYSPPVLRAANNGSAVWDKINTNSQWQRGTGWQAKLTGGVQTGDDWGGMFFPTQEQKVTEFKEAQWSYYMTGAETMGVNIVIWVHDPNSLNKRAEITQLGNTALLGKTLGWNGHKLLSTTTQFVWNGEDWSGGSAAALTGSDLTSGTQYTWAQFQADVLFSTFEIYRISLEHGWESSGTFDAVWVVEAKFNGQSIPFVPSVEEIFAADTPLAKVGHNITGLADNVKTVTTPLTDVSIVASSTPAKVVIIQAQTDNTGAVAVGGEGVVATIATGTGIILYAGDSITLEVDDLADVWIDAIVGGEGVRFTYLT